jgi:cytochrome c biogenesis protein CcdA
VPDPIEWSQIWIANWATDAVYWLPLGYAFGAGMVSAANPCGFAMLPAYLSLYLGIEKEDYSRRPALARIGNAYFIGLMVTLGFVFLFGTFGLAISTGGQFLLSWMPWAGLATGVVLAIVGVLALSGRHVYPGAMARIAARVNIPERGGARVFFLFGIGYAIASLACTLPVFLVVVGSSIAAQGTLSGLVQFVSYALGMGFVLVALTIGMAVFKGAAVGPFRGMLPYVERTSSLLVLVMGSYLVYYWLTKGGILD